MPMPQNAWCYKSHPSKRLTRFIMRMVSRSSSSSSIAAFYSHQSMSTQKSRVTHPVLHPFRHQHPHVCFITIILRRLGLEGFRIDTAAVGLQRLFVICFSLVEIHVVWWIRQNIPAIGFLLTTVSECCRPFWPLGLRLPMGRGPVILRAGLSIARRCWELGRGEGVGVARILKMLAIYTHRFGDINDVPYDPCQSQGSI
jgi:hypothetical protein